MALEECIHGIVGPCSICRGRRPAGGSDALVVEATYASRCPGCGEPIEVGDLIGKPPDVDYFVCEPCVGSHW